MSNRLVFAGLAELKAALRTLPADLTGEADVDISETAEGAAAAVRAAYQSHRVTGNLANHVVVTKKRDGPLSAGYTVKSTAPHATMFERGTEARHYITVRGKTKLVGRSPGFNIFGPIMARKRREMWDGLGTLLTKHGLVVSGTP